MENLRAWGNKRAQQSEEESAATTKGGLGDSLAPADDKATDLAEGEVDTGSSRNLLTPMGADDPGTAPGPAETNDGAVTFADAELDEVEAAAGDSAEPADALETYANSIREAAATASEGGPAAALLGEKVTYEQRPTHEEVALKEELVHEVADEVPEQDATRIAVHGAVDKVMDVFSSSDPVPGSEPPTPAEAYAASRVEAAETTEDSGAATSLMEDVPTTDEVAQKNETVLDIGSSVPTETGESGALSSMKGMMAGLMGAGAAAGAADASMDDKSGSAATTGQPDPLETYAESIEQAADTASSMMEGMFSGGSDDQRPTAGEIANKEDVVAEVDGSVPVDDGRLGATDTLKQLAKDAMSYMHTPKAEVEPKDGEQRFAESLVASTEATGASEEEQSAALGEGPSAADMEAKKEAISDVPSAASGGLVASLMGAVAGSSTTASKGSDESPAVWEEAVKPAEAYVESLQKAVEDSEVDVGLGTENAPVMEETGSTAERPTYGEVSQHMSVVDDVQDSVKTKDGPSLAERASEAVSSMTASSKVKSEIPDVVAVGADEPSEGFEISDSAELKEKIEETLGDTEGSTMSGLLNLVGSGGNGPEAATEHAAAPEDEDEATKQSRRANAPATSMTDTMKSMFGAGSSAKTDEGAGDA